MCFSWGEPLNPRTGLLHTESEKNNLSLNKPNIEGIFSVNLSGKIVSLI